MPVSFDVTPAASNGMLVTYAVAADGTHHWLSTQPAVADQTTYSFNWPVMQPAGSGYLARVWYVDGTGNWLSSDDSDEPFTINAGNLPQPTVTTPNTATSFTQGDLVPVSFDVTPAASNGMLVTYAVAADGTHHWLSTQPAVADQTTYSFNWPVMQPAGSGYLARVWYVDGTGNWLSSDDADEPFTINAGNLPQPTVTTPNTATSFAQGTAVPVRFDLDSPASSGSLLTYAVAADGTLYLLKSQPAVADQTTYSFSWPVVQPAGSGYRVSVWYVDAAGNWLYSDDSDAAFTITP